jgi:hypothetical protein
MSYETYLDQAKKLHEIQSKWRGTTVRQYIPEINKLRKEYNLVTMLDYGCGKAQFHDASWNAVKYDPAILEFSTRPTGRFDLVISTDVLEHIPEEHIENTIADIFNYSDRWVFVSVCCREAREILPNGMNAHATVKSESWWKDKFSKYKNYKLAFTG